METSEGPEGKRLYLFLFRDEERNQGEYEVEINEYDYGQDM